MRISIKIKFSVFLAALLLLTVSILSLLVLKGIEKDQQMQYEEFLAQQARIANLYFVQSSLSETNMTPSDFLSAKGKEIAEQLGMLNGQLVSLYDNNGKKVGESIAKSKSNDFKEALSYALKNKVAYQVEGDSIYYMAPLKIRGEQIGVVQLYYSLARNHEFYSNIKTLFIYIGAIIFILSFFLGYLYFNSFAHGILRLKNIAEEIRQGQYNTEILERRDELGELSEGIYYMSRQIMKTIEDMESEQKKLILAVEKLSRLEKQQKQFIGNVTHEFKTPLTSIKAYIDLLEMYPDDSSLLETAKINIKNETNRLYSLVDKVLQLSALEKYEFEYAMEEIEVQDLILKVCSSLKGKIDKFGIELETNLIEAFIEGDRESMTIILVNLLDNAIKYNKTNGKIFVRSYIVDSKVCIEISDTGIGMPKEASLKIFEPFYTVDKNRSRQKGGIGLGLSLVKELVGKQKGSITLLKTGSEGSTFKMLFPASYEKYNK